MLFRSTSLLDMNPIVDDLDITFRPPWHMVAFWLLGAGGLLLFGILVVGPVLHAPNWVRCFFVGLSSLGVLVGLQLSFAVVRANREGLGSHHHTRGSARWEDVEAWTQWGTGGSVYLRTRDGRIRGFSSWCVYGDRCDGLARALEQRVGPGVAGEATIAPKLLGRVL